MFRTFLEVSLFGFGFTCLFRQFNSNTSCIVIKQKLHCCYYADINTIVFPILPNLNSEYLFLRHFCIYLYLVLVLLVYFANLTVLHHTLVIKQKLEPEDHSNLVPKHHKQSSPKADLKTSPYVTVHIKIITWKFHILSPKESRVTHP